MSKARSKSARGKRRAPAVSNAGAAPANTAAPRLRLPGKWFEPFMHLAVPVVFFVFVWTWHPFHTVSEFDPDEGNNVIKALMLSKGHALYSEIWSDQPPLFTYMLRGWFAVTGWTVQQGHDLLERIEADIRGILSEVTILTHLEPIEDPASQHDIGLDRRA